jgi:hypothetical protein
LLDAQWARCDQIESFPVTHVFDSNVPNTRPITAAEAKSAAHIAERLTSPGLCMDRNEGFEVVSRILNAQVLGRNRKGAASYAKVQSTADGEVDSSVIFMFLDSCISSRASVT